MKKNSTPLSILESSRHKMPELRPRRRTIEAIRQFARAYSYEPKLAGELANFIAN